MPQKYHNTKTPDAERDLWRTPQEIFLGIERWLDVGFALDAASSVENKLVARAYLTEADDALEKDWSKCLCPFTKNPTVWCNPPYSDVMPWVMKSGEQAGKGISTVLLLPASTSVGWFRRLTLVASEIYFVIGRIQFGRHNPDGKRSSNNAGSIIAVVRPGPRRSCKLDVVERDMLEALGSESA